MIFPSTMTLVAMTSAGDGEDARRKSELLLNACADVNHRDKFKSSPLDLAISREMGVV